MEKVNKFIENQMTWIGWGILLGLMFSITIGFDWSNNTLNVLWCIPLGIIGQGIVGIIFGV